MPLKYSLVTKILKDLWFTLVRTNGSHFRYEKHGLWLTVWFHEEYPPKTAKSMLKDICRIEKMDYPSLVKKYGIKL